MKDKVVLITGGAGNVGRATTRSFLEAGARVAVPFHKHDLADTFDYLKPDYPDQIFTFGMDLTTERGAYEAVRQVVEWAGQLDSVVHLVGGYRGGGLRIADTPIETWDRMIDLNLKSAWLIARAAIPELLKGGGGSMVFVSSRAARRDRGGHAAYAIAKSALLTLSETIAEEYGEEGLRANAVLPGIVDTQDNREASPDADHAKWTQPEEIARVIAFLASSAAGAVNGACVPVYGKS